MENPASHPSSVPIWVWLAIGVVVLVAFSSSKSSASQPTIVNTGPSDSTNALEAAKIASQRDIAVAVLSIAGTEDIARIQARTQEVYGEQQIRGITAMGQANNPQPPAPVNININKNSTSTAPASSTAGLSQQRSLALASSNVRTKRIAVLNSVAGALADGIHFAQAVF